ncbi:MAG TPA: F0F1 ATP synthase subunit A [Pantanalinema sp.]
MSQAFLLAEAESAEHGAPAAEHGAEHGAAASHAGGHGAGHTAELSIIPDHWKMETPYGVVHVDTVLSTVFAMAIALIAFGMLGRSVAMRPADVKVKRASAIEQILGFIQKILDDFVGKGSSKYLWYVGSLFIFILVANWLSLLPWAAWQLSGLANGLASALHVNAPHGLVYHAPTADLNTTVALALLSLAMYWVAGIAKNGVVGFLGHHWFAKPAVLFPLRMLEDITRPVSLALRLFANILAGHIVGTVLLGMALVGAAALLPLEMFVGAIQAFIFATLSASYIGGAVQEHH